ncbi:MAG TPA: hypothetical protein VFD43_10345, partial [Planctomycetota bacterium]|nr:hypothetical protein [Planctomycetota bacterium]
MTFADSLAARAAPAWGQVAIDVAIVLRATLQAALDDAVLALGGTGRARGTASREQAVASEDASDISATLGGDGGAFARLVARHQQAVARHLLRFARDP